jgi:hypothetical protein
VNKFFSSSASERRDGSEMAMAKVKELLKLFLRLNKTFDNLPE